MKRTLIALALAAVLVPAAQAAPAEKGNYKIDPVHSGVYFTVTHLGVSRFTGRFDAIKGEVVEDGAASRVVAEIDVASVNSGFADRDKHLKSPDFFSAAQFPKIRFESSKLALDDKGAGTLAGSLTLRGVTKPVSFKVQHVGASKDPWGGYRSGYSAVATIKRSEFGMNFMPGGIGDEVELVINIESIKQ